MSRVLLSPRAEKQINKLPNTALKKVVRALDLLEGTDVLRLEQVSGLKGG